MRSWQQALLAAFLGGVALLISSCSSQKRVYPVEGKVLCDGRPAAGATVRFHPTGANEKDPLVPQAQVGADGTFRLTTFEFEDGAPAGHYAVSVLWGLPSKGGDGIERMLVAPRYLNPDTSGLTADIPEQETKLKPFIVTR
jgi:hypothetical protein